MPYGLRDSDLALIVDAIKAFPEVERVLLFGSRAKGNFKAGSDVDLAIQGEAVGYETAVQLAGVLNEEKPLPYYFDVLDYAGITEPRLVEHIDRVGIVIYDRASQPGHA